MKQQIQISQRKQKSILLVQRNGGQRHVKKKKHFFIR